MRQNITTRADGYPVVLVGSESYFARLHHRLRQRLPIWVVYAPVTQEYPGRWVTRMHISLPQPRPTRFVLTHDTLDDLRTLLPPGLVCLARLPTDLPEIWETWL